MILELKISFSLSLSVTPEPELDGFSSSSQNHPCKIFLFYLKIFFSVYFKLMELDKSRDNQKIDILLWKLCSPPALAFQKPLKKRRLCNRKTMKSDFCSCDVSMWWISHLRHILQSQIKMLRNYDGLTAQGTFRVKRLFTFTPILCPSSPSMQNNISQSGWSIV